MSTVFANSRDRAEVRGEAATPALHNLTLQKHDSWEPALCVSCTYARVCVWVFMCAIWHREQINHSAFRGEVVCPKTVCENVRGRRVHAFLGVRVCEQKKGRDEQSVKQVTIWQARGVFVPAGMATSLHPLHAMCVGVFLSICQFDTHTRRNSHAYTHTKKPCCQSACS